MWQDSFSAGGDLEGAKEKLLEFFPENKIRPSSHPSRAENYMPFVSLFVL